MSFNMPISTYPPKKFTGPRVDIYSNLFSYPQVATTNVTETATTPAITFGSNSAVVEDIRNSLAEDIKINIARNMAGGIPDDVLPQNTNTGTNTDTNTDNNSFWSFDAAFGVDGKSGWAMPAIQGANSLLNAWLGFRNLGLQEDALIQQQDQFAKNYEMQKKAFDFEYENRQKNQANLQRYA